MRYKYYGTAAAEGIPAIYCECELCKKARTNGGKDIRTRSQCTVDDTLLIDYPADTYWHTFSGLDLRKIRTYLITHSHQDHLYEAELRMREKGYAILQDYSPIHVYGGIDVCNKIHMAVAESAEPYVQLHLIQPFEPFEADGYRITPLAANHDRYSDPMIFLIEKDGTCILHSNDTGYYPEKTFEYLSSNPVHIDLASFDCTEPLRKPDNHKVNGHMNLATVCYVKERLQEIGCIDENTVCVLNHFSHNGKLLHEEIESLVKEKGFLVSYDGLELDI